MALDFSKIKEKAKNFYDNTVQPTVKDVSKRFKNGVQAFMGKNETPPVETKHYDQVNFQSPVNEISPKLESDYLPKEHFPARSLTCPNCGGIFAKEDLTDGDEIVTCIHCRTTYSTNDIFQKSTTERIEETRTQAYITIEHEKIEAQTNAHVTIEHKKIEAEKEIALSKYKDKEQRNLDKIEKLKELLDSGSITKNEYNKRKKKLLSRIK